MNISVKAIVRQRANLSVLHLLSAATCSKRTHELEASHAGQEFGPFWEEILAQASSVIMLSVAGLEAYANELFTDHEDVFPALRTDLMAKLWEMCEQKPILEKFEFAVLLKKSDPFDRGAKAYQDVAALIKLRNALVHFKPEWLDNQEEHAKISKLLKSRIQHSPFFKNGPLFPLAWAGSNCTEWAVQSVITFVLGFEQRIGVERLTKYKDRFNVGASRTKRHCAVRKTKAN